MEARRLFGLGLVLIAAGASSVLAGHACAEPPMSVAPDRRAVPILMYHVIADPPPSAPYPGLYVRREELRAQVRRLAGAGTPG